MKKDIVFPEVKEVSLAIARKPLPEGGFEWFVYLLNKSSDALLNILVVSHGYGEIAGERRETTKFRHHFDHIAAKDTQLIERIDEQVFGLANEFWVSFYKAGDQNQIYDKRYIFMPGSILDDNVQFIPLLQLEGVLHA